jgi:hypothetical protein
MAKSSGRISMSVLSPNSFFFELLSLLRPAITKCYTTAGHWWLTPVILATGGRDQEDHGLKPAWANSS